ncbi:hypothetical protein ACFL2H_11685 [Planctomycetota bacterium]
MPFQSRAIETPRILPLLLVAFFTTTAISQEFAVQNKVMQGSTVRNETRTLITPDAYYDVLFQGEKPAQVSTYLPGRRQQYCLVNLRHSTKATIDVVDVHSFVAQVVLRAKDHKNPHVKFAANPNFREQQEGDSLLLKSDVWSYVVEMKPTDDVQVVDAYRKFADAFARLNAFTSFPPNARLELNRAIHRAASLPTRVEVRLEHEDERYARKQVTLHTYDWELSDADRKIIDATKRGIVEFEKVSLKEFQKTR